MCLGIKFESRRLEKVAPILLVLCDVRLKADDKRAAKTSCLSTRLRVVYSRSEFLYCKERTKRREETAPKLGPIVGHHVVQHALWYNALVEDY